MFTSKNISTQEAVTQAVKVIHGNKIFESRIVKTTSGTVSGYFDNPDDLVNSIEIYNGKNDIYFTLNSIDSALMARSSNKLTRSAKQTTSDNEVINLNYLFVDIDPKRPAGISSTDEEKKRAADVLMQILIQLSKHYGFPPPIVCDSGNGYHLLYKIDLPNTRENVEMLKKFLQALDFLFSTDTVEVDKTTFNPSRIVKLYGTIACKGSNTADRPHRQSQILKVPDKIIAVLPEQIKSVIAVLPEKEKAVTENATTKTSGKNNSDNKIDIQKWCEKYNLDIAYRSDFHGEGTKYIFKTCPFNSEHTDKSAFLIQFKNGGLSAGCHHNSCKDENWHTLREKYEPDYDKNKSDSGDKPESESQANAILRLASVAELFRDDKEDLYARIPVKDHTEVYKIGGKKFTMWLSYQYYLETGRTFKKDALNQALGVLTGIAMNEGEEKLMYKRCAWFNDTLYYDLNNENKEVVRISANGWEIVSDTEILFSRSKLMLAQVTPVNADNENLLVLLEKHYRFKNNDDKILHTVNLVLKFVPHIPHLLDVLFGEKGALRIPDFYHPDRLLLESEGKIVTVFEEPYVQEGFAYELNHMSECVQKGLLESPRMSHADSIAVMRVMDALRAEWGVTYPADAGA